MKNESPRVPLLRRPLRCFAVLLLSGSLIMSSGCFGRFPLTHSAYRFNRNISDNEFWQNVVFWVFSFAVYPIFFTIDVWILNVIQFWSGESLELSRLEYIDDGNRIIVHALDEDGREVVFQLERRGADGFAVLDEDGDLKGVVRRLPDGGIAMTSAEGVVGRLPGLALPSSSI